MAAATMAEPKKGTSPRPQDATGPATPEPGADDLEITTYKCFKRIARLLNKICSHANCTQPEALLRYERFMEEDLLHLIEQERAGLLKKKGKK